MGNTEKSFMFMFRIVQRNYQYENAELKHAVETMVNSALRAAPPHRLSGRFPHWQTGRLFP